MTAEPHFRRLSELPRHSVPATADAGARRGGSRAAEGESAGATHRPRPSCSRPPDVTVDSLDEPAREVVDHPAWV